MKAIKESDKVTPNAPPVFVLHAHRNYEAFRDRVDTSYQYTVSDFPTAEKLHAAGIQQVVYLSEADQQGWINKDFQSVERLTPDLRPVFERWIESGVKVLYTGIAPQDRSKEHQIQLPLSVML